jgi:hypothetical protein
MDGLACNPCLVLLGIHAAPLDTQRLMSRMLRSAIMKLVHPANAVPVKKQRTSVSKLLVGCHLAAGH